MIDPWPCQPIPLHGAAQCINFKISIMLHRRTAHSTRWIAIISTTRTRRLATVPRAPFTIIGHNVTVTQSRIEVHRRGIIGFTQVEMALGHAGSFCVQEPKRRHNHLGGPHEFRIGYQESVAPRFLPSRDRRRRRRRCVGRWPSR